MLNKLLQQYEDMLYVFAEEVMLAEENKNAGPSALDGKSAEIYLFHGFIFHLDAFVVRLLLIILLSPSLTSRVYKLC